VRQLKINNCAQTALDRGANMSWLKSHERARANEPVEIFSKLEGEIREFVRRDATPPSAAPQQGKDSELIVTHVGSLVQQVSGASVQEIEKLIAELHMLRETLQNEAARVQREIMEYANLIQDARQSLRTISESLRFWKGDPAAPRVSA
jgi:hypothetical protein